MDRGNIGGRKRDRADDPDEGGSDQRHSNRETQNNAFSGSTEPSELELALSTARIQALLRNNPLLAQSMRALGGSSAGNITNNPTASGVPWSSQIPGSISTQAPSPSRALTDFLTQQMARPTGASQPNASTLNTPLLSEQQPGVSNIFGRQNPPQNSTLTDMIASRRLNLLLSQLPAQTNESLTLHNLNQLLTSGGLAAAPSPPSPEATGLGTLASMISQSAIAPQQSQGILQASLLPQYASNQQQQSREAGLAALLSQYASNHQQQQQQEAQLAALLSRYASNPQLQQQQRQQQQAYDISSSVASRPAASAGLGNFVTAAASLPHQNINPSTTDTTLLSQELAALRGQSSAASLAPQDVTETTAAAASVAQSLSSPFAAHRTPAEPSLTSARAQAPSSSDGISAGPVTAPSAAAAAAAAAAPLPIIRGSIGKMVYVPEQDEENLAPYQVLARKHIEFFAADQGDLDAGCQGRNKPIVLGQVGLRCRHCANLPYRQKNRASTYYPSKVVGIYQAALNIAMVHLNKMCHCVPAEVRQELLRLHSVKSQARGGKKYWADCARAKGVIDTEDNGLRFVEDKK